MRSKLKHNLLISAAAVVVLVGTMEIVLRVAGYGNVETYEPDQDLIWRLKPNQDTYTKFGQRPVHINSFGLRDREFSVEKSPNVCRILILGNSCTYGWGVFQDSTYPKILEQELNSRGLSDKVYEVINGGVIGYSVAQELEYLKRDGLAWKPDWVLVSHTFNEGKRVNPRSPQETKDRVFFSMRIKNVLRNVALYHFLVEFNFSHEYVKLARKVTEDPTWIDEQAFQYYRQDLQEIANLCQTNGIRLAFLLTVTRNQIDSDVVRYSRHQKAMQDIGPVNGVPVVDFMHTFRDHWTDDLYIDGGHPTEFGHRLMALEILKMLVPSLGP